jgi:2-oxoglutarate ferredoxin oxidoreductase subunit delta
MAEQDGIQRHEQGDWALITIREWCKGCDLCLSSCPTGILALAEDGRISVLDVSRCIFCGLCAARCPDFVFILERPAARATVPAEA